MYESAWSELKTKVSPSTRSAQLLVAANPAFHKRIFKAICKEKDEDTLQKLAFQELGFSGYLTRKSKAGQLTVTLTLRIDSHIGIGDIT